MKLIIKFSPEASSYFFSSETNTSSSSPCSQSLSAYVLPNVTDLGLDPYRTISKITRPYVVTTLMTIRKHTPYLVSQHLLLKLTSLLAD